MSDLCKLLLLAGLGELLPYDEQEKIRLHFDGKKVEASLEAFMVEYSNMSNTDSTAAIIKELEALFPDAIRQADEQGA